MCNQAVSLVAAEIERNGIPTVAVQMLREVAERVQPPRALVVPFRHGFPLGGGKPEVQKEVLRAALAMISDSDLDVPAIRAFRES